MLKWSAPDINNNQILDIYIKNHQILAISYIQFKEILLEVHDSH